MSLASVLFHLPLFAAAWLVAARFQSRPIVRLRDSFLIALLAWRLEHLALGAIGQFNAVAVGLTHLVGLALAWFYRYRGPQTTSSDPPPAAPIESLAIGWLTVGVAAALLRIAAYPDPYDSLTYHLMLPATWIATGGLELVPTYFGDLAPSYTPESVESCFAMLMLPFGGDAIARVGQLPFAALAGYSVARLASTRDDGAVEVNGALGGFLFLMLPELFEQATGSMVDLAAASLMLSSMDQIRDASLMRDDRGRSARLLLAGATAGLFLSSRFTSPIFLLMALPSLAVAAGRRVRCWAWFAGGLFAFGCYPYVRNWVLTGNPVFPLEVAGMPGLFTRDATLANRYHLSALSDIWSLALHRFGSIGVTIFAVGILAPWGWLAQRGHPARPAILLALAALTGVALHFALVPYNANTRFLFAPWGCAVAATTLLFRAFPRGLAMLSLALVALIAFARQQAGQLNRAAEFPFPSVDPERVVPLVLIALVLIGTSIGWAMTEWKKSARWIAFAVITFAIGIGIDLADNHRRTHWVEIVSRDPRVRGCEPGLRVISKIDAATIAYAGRNLPYLLRGPDGRHRVVFAPVDGSALNALPHEFADPAAPVSSRSVALLPDRRAPNRARWRKRLLEEQVDYLAIFGGDSIELDWATETPGLEPVETRGMLQVFRILRP